MLKFLETNFNIDIQQLLTQKIIQLSLTCDQSNSVPNAISAYFVDGDGNQITSNIPFSISITKSTNQLFTLTLDASLNTHFYPNSLYNVKIINTANNDTYTITLKLDYFTSLNESLWQNSDKELYTLTNIGYKNDATSKEINNIFRSIINNTSFLYSKINNIFKLYNQNKPIDDILSLVQTGIFPINSTVQISKNVNGDISSILISYTDNSKFILASYIYADYDIVRVVKKNGTSSDIETGSISLLNSINVSEVKSDESTVIRKIGTITINRSTSEFNNIFLSDYNASLSSDVIDIDPNNILSEYKYYRTNTIVGYNVVVY